MKSRIKKKEFLKLYNKGLNDREISDIMKISDSTINSFRLKLKLPVNLKNNKIKPNRIQKSILIGSLLGDLHLNLRKGNINADGSFAHSEKQEKYFLYKYNILKNLCGKYYKYKIYNKNTNKNYNVIAVNLRTNSYLTYLYNISYKNKIKYIDRDLLKDFTSRSLAIMYCDDGSKIRTGYQIATNCFNNKDLDLFRNFLKNKWNLETSIHKGKILYIKTRSAKKFKSIVSPYIIKEMQYKL